MDQHDNWSTVPNKRVTSPGNLQAHKKATPINYWNRAPTTTANRFNGLQTDDASEANEARSSKDTPDSLQAEVVPKPPPIFIYGIKDIQPLTKQLNITAGNGYFMKILPNDQVKVQPKSPECFSSIIKVLAEKEFDFHTFQLKHERSYRVVLKNMHPTADTKEIIAELLLSNHDVRNIHNIREKTTKKPLSMFFIDLAPKDNNKDIYNIQILLRCRVSFEPPHQKKEVPQCYRCQRYGHTYKYCYHSPRCVKCAGDHATKDCLRKEKSTEVKCVLCGANHPANYKGCTFYRDPA
jgi:hypothetical protein